MYYLNCYTPGEFIPIASFHSKRRYYTSYKRRKVIISLEKYKMIACQDMPTGTVVAWISLK